jgi:hypothetical protein
LCREKAGGANREGNRKEIGLAAQLIEPFMPSRGVVASDERRGEFFVGDEKLCAAFYLLSIPIQLRRFNRADGAWRRADDHTKFIFADLDERQHGLTNANARPRG